MAKGINPIIDEALRTTRTRSFEAAELLGVSGSTYDRMMRKELPESEQKRIADLIHDFARRGYKNESDQ